MAWSVVLLLHTGSPGDPLTRVIPPPRQELASPTHQTYISYMIPCPFFFYESYVAGYKCEHSFCIIGFFFYESYVAGYKCEHSVCIIGCQAKFKVKYATLKDFSDALGKDKAVYDLFHSLTLELGDHDFEKFRMDWSAAIERISPR